MRRATLVLIAAILAAACAGSTSPQAAPTAPNAGLGATPAGEPMAAVPSVAVLSTAEPDPPVLPNQSMPNPPASTPAPTVSVEEPVQPGLIYVASTLDRRFDYYVDAPPFDDRPAWARIYVDRGDGPELAMNDEQDRYIFGANPRFEIDASGVVRFKHEASGTYWINYFGRVDDSGIIRDVHAHTDGLAPDGGGPGDGLVHDAFVLDAVDLQIDRSRPLVESVMHPDATIGGWWYTGATRSADPACGASTLYADDADGYRRVLPEGVELDTVVAVHAAPVTPLSVADASASGRSVVLLTSCPEAYDGVRIVTGTSFARRRRQRCPWSEPSADRRGTAESARGSDGGTPRTGLLRHC